MSMPALSLSLTGTSAQSVPSDVAPADSSYVCCTALKMQRYALYLFSASSFAGGTALVLTSLTGVIPLIAGLASVPFYFLSYYLGKEGYAIWDYQDPSELQILRQAALGTTLIDLSARHGWHNVFRYALYTPANFTIAFNHQAQQFDINRLILMHKKATEGLNLARQNNDQIQAFAIPDLTAHRARFHQEVRESRLTCDQILVKYNIEDLHAYGFIPEAEVQLLRQLKPEYDQVVRECRIQIGHIDASFRSQAAGSLPSPTIASGQTAQIPMGQPMDFSLLRNHLGLEVFSESAYRRLTPQQSDQRRRALFFHQTQLQARIEAINTRYTNYRAGVV